MKKTATEWLFEKLWETPKDKLNWNALLEQAKEIEKNHIQEAFDIGFDRGYDFGIGHDYHEGENKGDQYYTQTYGK